MQCIGNFNTFRENSDNVFTFFGTKITVHLLKTYKKMGITKLTIPNKNHLQKAARQTLVTPNVTRPNVSQICTCCCIVTSATQIESVRNPRIEFNEKKYLLTNRRESFLNRYYQRILYSQLQYSKILIYHLCSTIYTNSNI